MKKWISMIVAMICIIGCTISMSACGEHTHDYDSEWSSNATQHWQECKNDGCDAKEKDKSNHVDEDKDGECDVCRYVMGEEHTHSLKKQEAKEATCTENGNEAYYECDECGKLYTDENGENEIDKNSVIISALGHDYENGYFARCGQKEEPEPTEGLKYGIDGNEAYVSGIGTATGRNIVIAKEYNGKPVTSIGKYAFFRCISSSITIPDSVTSIGENAFSNCRSLTSITIGNSVTSIGEYAFRDCSGLTSIEIPDSVTSIGISAFSNTAWYNNQAEGIVYAGKVAYEYKGEMPSNTRIVLKEGTKGIAERAFSDCSGLTSIEIPDSVTSIGYRAFYNTAWYNNQANGIVYAGKVAYEYKGGMPSNTRIELKEGTKGIADRAFYDCSGLTSILIPNSVTSIGAWAFEDCSGLTGITIPDSVTSIGNGVFSACPIEQATIPAMAIRYIKNSSLKKVIITSGDSIGEQAFSECSSLTGIEIGNSVTSIGNGAFYGCSGLTSVTIGNGVTSIGEDAFYNTAWYNNQAEGLIYAGKIAYKYKGIMPNNTRIVLKEGTKGIADSAFSNCSGLTSITISNSVTSIGESAFKYCSGLTSITIPNSTTSIGRAAFNYCSELEKIEVEEGNTAYSSVGNCLVEIASKTLIAGCKNSIIPKDGSVTSIDSRAFAWCRNLTSITIPNSVTSIGGSAFYDCSGLTSITYSGTIAEWNTITKGNNWDSNTGNYTIHCTDGDIVK